MLRLRQASATTAHRIQPALQRPPRANNNPGSRSVNSTTQHPDTSPIRGTGLCGSCPGVASRRHAQLVAGGSRFGCGQPRQAHRRARPQRCEGRPRTVRVRPRIGNRRRGRLPRETSPNQGWSSGSFLDPASRRPLSRDGRHTSARMEAGRELVDSPSPPAWIDVVAGSTTRITLDSHGH